VNITAKSRYALKIMMDLAVQEDHGHQQRHNIAQRQNIPLDFMDQITSRLRAAGLVASIRGRSGGFQLSKLTTEISPLAADMI
jgi:Rrf2 family protein